MIRREKVKEELKHGVKVWCTLIAVDVFSGAVSQELSLLHAMISSDSFYILQE